MLISMISCFTVLYFRHVKIFLLGFFLVCHIFSGAFEPYQQVGDYITKSSTTNDDDWVDVMLDSEKPNTSLVLLILLFILGWYLNTKVE